MMFCQTVVVRSQLCCGVLGSQLQEEGHSMALGAGEEAGSVLGTELEPLTSVAEKRTLAKLIAIMSVLIILSTARHRSTFSGSLLSQSCSTDRLRSIMGIS